MALALLSELASKTAEIIESSMFFSGDCAVLWSAYLGGYSVRLFSEE